MDQVRYLTEAKVEEFRKSIGEHLEWYYSGNGDGPRIDEGDLRLTDIQWGVPSTQLSLNQNRPHMSDAVNALAVYRAMDQLTRYQASDERLWVYLCHTTFANYSRARWLGKGRTSSIDGDVRRVRNHFFAKGNRAVFRDNAISRLWWLGSIAYDIDRERPDEVLNLILFRQEVRSSLLDRVGISSNRRVLQMICRIMGEHWREDQDKRLFSRVAFRDWMKEINRRGGVLLLDALGEGALMGLLRREAKRAARSAGGSD